MSKVKRKKGIHRHRFSFHTMKPDGTPHSIHQIAIVRTPRAPVEVPITARDADDAIEAHGCGNSQLCTVSTAIARNAELFEHKVIGITDFYKRTCFIASKINKKGEITECYRYLHNDNFADLNDKPGELKKLAADLHKNGSQKVILRPRVRTDTATREGRGKRTGERSSKSMGEYAPRGARRRFALAIGGLFPGLKPE